MNNDQIIDIAFNKVKINIEQALFKAGAKMQAEARDKLKNNNNYSSTNLIKGVIFKINKTSDKIELIFGNNSKSGNNYSYPSVIEYGRRPGLKAPPTKSILEWLFKKSRIGSINIDNVEVKSRKKSVKAMNEKILKGIAFVIARKIGKEGIKGNYIMTNAFKLGVEYFRKIVK